MDNKISSALGLPPGSVRAILALVVIGGTTLAFLILVIHATWTNNPEVLIDVIDGGAVWFAIVTMIATFYFNTGQSTDAIKDAENLIKGVRGGNKDTTDKTAGGD